MFKNRKDRNISALLGAVGCLSILHLLKVTHTFCCFSSFFCNPWMFFTSASCVEERVGGFRNGFTLGPQSYPSSLRPNLGLAVPENMDWPESLGAIQTPTSVFNSHCVIKVPKRLAPDPAWHTTSAEPGSQPCLLMGRERHHQAVGHSQWGAIRERSVGLF